MKNNNYKLYRDSALLVDSTIVTNRSDISVHNVKIEAVCLNGVALH
jgi:hypothetical protein